MIDCGDNDSSSSKWTLDNLLMLLKSNRKPKKIFENVCNFHCNYLHLFLMWFENALFTADWPQIIKIYRWNLIWCAEKHLDFHSIIFKTNKLSALFSSYAKKVDFAQFAIVLEVSAALIRWGIQIDTSMILKSGWYTVFLCFFKSSLHLFIVWGVMIVETKIFKGYSVL